MPLPDLIAGTAERFAGKTALVFPDQSISFGALYLQSRLVAARLQRLGIGPGARVAILHENALAPVIFFWGILASGAQVVDVPCLAGVETIDEILAECQPAAIVLSVHQRERLMQTGAKALPGVVLMEAPSTISPGVRSYYSLSEIVASESSDATLPRMHDSSVALIIYTSGTTGRPKGVMLSHRNLLTNIAAANSRVGLTSDDSILMVVPLHFIHGRMQLLTHTLVGGTIAFSEGFHFPQQVIQELAKYQVTGFSGTPYHFYTLLERTDIAATRLPQLRYVLVTGGAMRPDGLISLSKALPGVEIHVAYGQTEASPRITYLGPLEVLSNPESSGRPLPGVLVQILAEDGSELPPGTVGEVVASGPNIMCGYVSGDESGSQKIDAFGRLHTGDIGRLDDHGHLCLAGRKSDLIKSAGERVFPREVEIVLDMHPAVRESAVLGVPDRILGEKIVACVVLKPGEAIDADAIRTHCLKLLPLVRTPREIRFTQGLPKTESGKIDRRGVVAHFNELGRANAAR
ncbi:MAG TPA: class I adenylate-forming enzyme family protein [Candidatus Angelobacter sp.]|jgi:acyl-CoA synthetase (AMP-forming)/AMP-acid ligase II